VEPATDAVGAYVQGASILAVTWSCAGARDPVRGILSRMDQVKKDAAIKDASALGWLKYGAAFYGYVLSSDPWGTANAAKEGLAHFEEAGDRRMTANIRASLGVMQAALFGLATAEATLRAGITVMEELKETVSFAYIAMHLALLLADRGAPERLDDARAL